MSQKQFDAACERHGFKTQGFLGYYDLKVAGREIHVSVHNAGERRRDQLAYLLRQRAKHEAPTSSETP